MKPILGREGLKRLQDLTRGRTALVLDYDGTICPIVPRASGAVLPARTRRLLRRVAKLYPTAILSGRKLSDVAKRARGCGIREIVGNHGLEWRGSPNVKSYEKLIHHCKLELERATREGRIHGAGIEVEDKKVSLSIHYRMAPNRSRARREILAVVKKLPGTGLITGKQVFNLLPNTRLNKGTAVLALRKKFGCDRVIYLGDDWTDEKVFRLPSKSFLVDVRVGRSKLSRARYFLPNVAATNRFLEELIRLREK